MVTTFLIVVIYFRLILLIQTRLAYFCRIVQRVRTAAPAGVPQKSPVWCGPKPALSRQKDSSFLCLSRWSGAASRVTTVGGRLTCWLSKWKNQMKNKAFVFAWSQTAGWRAQPVHSWCYPNMVTVAEKWAPFRFTWAEFLRKFVRMF